MLNSINEVKRQYMYAVQPVKLFETQNKKAETNNPFANLIETTNNSKYNLNHPNVSNTTSGGRLDFLG